MCFCRVQKCLAPADLLSCTKKSGFCWSAFMYRGFFACDVLKSCMSQAQSLRSSYLFIVQVWHEQSLFSLVILPVHCEEALEDGDCSIHQTTDGKLRYYFKDEVKVKKDMVSKGRTAFRIVQPFVHSSHSLAWCNQWLVHNPSYGSRLDHDGSLHFTQLLYLHLDALTTPTPQRKCQEHQHR